MAFFGSAPSSAASPSFPPPPDKAPAPLFGQAPTTSGPTFGEAPAKASGPFFGQAVKDDTGFLLFDNSAHSGDQGGQPMDGRGDYDEAANVYKEIEARGHEITTTSATDAQTLEALLADVATFILPEAEGGSAFPDGDTVFRFVESGGNLLFFGGAGVGGAQLNYINDTFDLSLTATYGGGVLALNEAGLSGSGELEDFLEGPAQMYPNNGSSFLNIDSLPEEATVVYGQGSETFLASLPCGDGQVMFIGWDFFNSFHQDNGWDEVFETVAELTAETSNGGAGLFGVAPADTSTSFFG